MSAESISIQCPFCFEWNEIPIEGEPPYHTIIDCEVCCHPIDINVAVDFETNEATATASKSSGFD